MTTKAICGECNNYGPCKMTDAKGNPWRCIARLLCVKRAYG
jgi:hypothetical protein